MTKRDYIKLADAFYQTRPQEHWDANKRQQWQQDMKFVANTLALDNSKFNRETFYKACGGTFDYM